MKPLVLCILDGVGIREEIEGNAVYKANMPVFKHLLNEYPNSLLDASGKDVGLPSGQMGNSEVGHTNMGAGRIVYQPLELINNKILNEEFFQNENLLETINYTKKNKLKLHIMGLLSDGGIHSHINHLYALLDMCKREQVEEVYLHLFLDGRDTLPTEGLRYLNELNDKIKEIGIGKICTLSGRYYAMDRDNNYDRIKKAYDAIVDGNGEKYSNYKEAIKTNLDKNITDEFIVPCVLDKGKIENKDGVIIFNFRPDRLREIGVCLTNPDVTSFPHKKLNIKLTTMMPVSDDVVASSAYELQKLDNTFGEYISKKGLTQLRIAETEKYAHVTYFFDGGVERKLKGAKRTLIASPKVATYDLMPEMSARKITNSLLKQINKYDVVILNFANGDMVGHTGNMDATVRALEVVDNCLGKIKTKVEELGGILVVTADHGNSDLMIDENGNKVTSHSTSKVPFIVTKDDIELKDGKLADIAPTLLTLLGLDIPEEMTGNVLIKDEKKVKGKNNFGLIFRIISIVFILSYVMFFGYRFVHFYSISHTKKVYVETNIVDKLNSYEIKTTGSGLYNCDGNNCFKGLVDNNYLYYNGLLWRIVSYTDDNIKLISEESLTTMKLSYNGINYIDSWLDELKSKLDNTYITDISLISSSEYESSKLGDTYLNNNTNWYTNDNKYVNTSGEITEYDDNIYSVRAVITISRDALIVSGDGSSANPYLIKKEDPFYVKDINIGTYIKFSDYLWRVVDKDDIGVKVVLESLLEEHIYSSSNKSFDITETGSLAAYLNNEFYNSLEKDLIKEANWSIIEYNSRNNYNYKSTNTVTAHVGLLNVGDLFINEMSGYFLMTEGGNNTIYKVNPYGSLYMDLKTSLRTIRPSLYLDNELVVGSGSGYKNSPYEIGE